MNEPRESCQRCGEVHLHCTAHSSSTGKACNTKPTLGSTVCWRHGASKPIVAAAAARRVELDKVKSYLERRGMAGVDPGQALLSMIAEATIRVVVAEAAEDDEKLGRWADRLANYSNKAIRAGLEERKVRMAEADARRLFGAVTKALEATGLTPAQEETFRATFAAGLRDIGG